MVYGRSRYNSTKKEESQEESQESQDSEEKAFITARDKLVGLSYFTFLHLYGNWCYLVCYPAKRLQMRSWQEEAHPLQARTPGRMLGLGNARYVLFSTLDSLIKHNVWVVCTSTQRKRRRKRRKVWVHQGFKRLHVLPILGCVVHQRKPKQQQRSAQTKTARRENHLIIPWWRNCLKGRNWNSWIPSWWNEYAARSSTQVPTYPGRT